MDDPIFKMRAKVASRAKGHVFEDRFMNLKGLQLMIAYRQALKEETKEKEETGEILKVAIERIEDNFKTLNIFANPKLWLKFEKEKELKEMREEINPDNFNEEWEKWMNILPQQVTVEEDVPDTPNLPKLDPKIQEIFTGFLPKKKITPKEGG